MLSIFIIALASVLGQVQDDDMPFGPLGVEAHSLFQTPGVGFTPDMPLELKADEVSIRTSFSMFNVYNTQGRYTVDLEYERFKFDLWYGVTDKLSFGLSVPVERVSGGHLDTLIQGFHKWAGLPEGNRGPKDKLNVSIDGKTYNVDPETTFGDIMLSSNLEITKFLCDDVTLGWYAGLHVKLPTTHTDLYCSHGTGVGLSMNFMARCGDWFFDAGVSVAYLGEYYILDTMKTTPYQELVFVTLERHLCGWASIVGQVLMTSGSAKGLDQYSKWSYELDLGFKIAIAERTTMNFGAFENMANFSNSADFGVFFGFECRH